MATTTTPLRAQLESWPVSGPFRSDWQRLHRVAIGANPFTAWEWISTAWDLFGSREDRIVPVRFLDETGETRAMALFREGRRRRGGRERTIWRTLDFNAQRITPILAPDLATWLDAVDSLFEMPDSPFWRMEWYKLDSLDGQLLEAVDELAERGLACQLRPFNEQPRLVLPDDWTEYRRSHSKSFWKSRRKSRNQLARRVGEIRYLRLREPEDFDHGRLEAALVDIETVFRASWQYYEIATQADYCPETVWRFHQKIIREFAFRGLADLNLLYVDGRPVSFDWNVRHEKSVYLVFGCYDQAFADYSTGTILTVDQFQDGHARGDRIYEFGGEFLRYKKIWTNDSVHAYRLTLQRKNAWTRGKKWLDGFRRSPE